MDGENKMEQYFFTVSTLIPQVFSLFFRNYATSSKTVLSSSTNHRVLPPRRARDGLISTLLHISHSSRVARTHFMKKREKDADAKKILHDANMARP